MQLLGLLLLAPSGNSKLLQLACCTLIKLQPVTDYARNSAVAEGPRDELKMLSTGTQNYTKKNMPLKRLASCNWRMIKYLSLYDRSKVSKFCLKKKNLYVSAFKYSLLHLHKSITTREICSIWEELIGFTQFLTKVTGTVTKLLTHKIGLLFFDHPVICNSVLRVLCFARMYTHVVFVLVF